MSDLSLDAYQTLAASTAYPADDACGSVSMGAHTESLLRLLYATTGLGGEAGEVLNKVKKIIRDDGGQLTDARREQLKKELGGTLWYVADVATQLGFTLGEVADANLGELARRHEVGTLQGDGDDR